MPELPEVEVIVRGLKAKIIGKRIKNVEVRHPKAAANQPQKLIGDAQGAFIKKIVRFGKIIIIYLSNQRAILIHLKLTGQLIYTNRDGKNYKGGHIQKVYDQAPPHKHTHIIIDFTDGSHLYFNDLRRFGWMKTVEGVEIKQNTGIVEKIITELGPDPTSPQFKIAEFIKRVRRRKNSNIYQVLMDQKVISGLGNIYVNEILWRNKINPFTKVGSVTNRQLKSIAKGILPLFQEAIKYGGSSANTFVRIDGSRGTFTDHLDVYHREGEKCHRNDGGIIDRKKIGGRSAFYCEECQHI